MPLSVITGKYRIKGASPDGDSIRFYPDDPTVWSKQNIKAKPNSQGGVQLRLDAIDALETHYTPPHAAHAWRQPVQFGDGAASRLLDLLGFADVTRDARGIVTGSTPDERPGYILTRFADVYGRAVSLAFAGTRRGRAKPDGTAFADVDELRRSVNYQLLDEGLVYPTFYSKLYVDFREVLAATAAEARSHKLGLWAQDSTADFTLTSVDQLTDSLVLLPKLFRRLAEYVTDADGSVALAGFKSFLSSHGDDRLYLVSNGQSTGLDTLIETKRRTVKVTALPEDMVFLET